MPNKHQKAVFRSIALCTLVMLSPIAAGAQSQVDGKMLYLSAIDSMRALPDPNYFSFEYAWVQDAGKSTSDLGWRTIERTSDQQTLFEREGTNDWHTGQLIVRPDLFLRPDVARASANDQAIHIDTGITEPSAGVIATVVARNVPYRITVVGTQAGGDCSGDIHLSLLPIGDPHKHNLRDLWIDPSARHVCKAIAIWHAAQFLWHTFDLAVTVWVTPDGFIDHWTSQGTARAGPFALGYTEDVRYVAMMGFQNAPLILSAAK